MRNEEEYLRGLLRDVVVAADQMRVHWVEGEGHEVVRKELWQALHTAADAARDEIYSL